MNVRLGSKAEIIKRLSYVHFIPESGQLFGSVSPRDIVAPLKAGGAESRRSHVTLNTPIKSIGQYEALRATMP